ncbi:MAG: hypothetical protein EOP22_11965 [Hyphomicrobiales bacterium]|nr:MAG: hypothetical protein EOP22_11965 [Hyphomicrobiales bacterium]
MKLLPLLGVLGFLALGAGSALAIEFKGFTPERQKIVEAAISEVAADFPAFDRGSRAAFQGILDFTAYAAAIKGDPFVSATFETNMRLRYAGDETCGGGAAGQVRHDDSDKQNWVATLRVCPLFFELSPRSRAELIAHELYHVVEGGDECYARYTAFWLRATNGKPYGFDGTWLDYECELFNDYLPPADLRAAVPTLLATESVAKAASGFSADTWSFGKGIIGVRSTDGDAYLGLACTPLKPALAYGIAKVGASTPLNVAELLIGLDVSWSSSLEGRAVAKVDNAYVNGRANGPGFLEFYGEVASSLAEIAGGARKTIVIEARAMEDRTLVFGRHAFTASGSSAAARYLLGGCAD